MLLDPEIGDWTNADTCAIVTTRQSHNPYTKLHPFIGIESVTRPFGNN